MTRPRNPNRTSQDDVRQALRLARKEKASRQVNLTIRESSRRRLNWLRDHHFKTDDQSMAIDLACLRLTGSLEPWNKIN